MSAGGRKLKEARSEGNSGPNHLAIEASDFVRTLRTAEKSESHDEIGSSLSWYLKARKIYPPSDCAQEGINRLFKRVLPES